MASRRRWPTRRVREPFSERRQSLRKTTALSGANGLSQVDSVVTFLITAAVVALVLVWYRLSCLDRAGHVGAALAATLRENRDACSRDPHRA